MRTNDIIGGLSPDEAVLTANARDEIDAGRRAPSELRCVACGALRTGRYCSECGQLVSPGRHTLRGFVSGAVRRLIGEEGAFRTARELFSNPGRVIRDYIAGRTKPYVHPAAYLLLTVAVFAIVVRLTSGTTGAGDTDRVLVLLVVPSVAAASRALFWRGRFNYAEHLLAVTYLSAQCLVILTVLFAGMLVVPQGAAAMYSIASLVVCVGYFVWAYSTIFEQRRWIAAAAGLLALLTGAVTWLALLSFVVNLIRA